MEKPLARRRRTGSLAPQPRPGRPPAFDAAARGRLRAAVADRPDATLAELRAACGVRCSLTAVQPDGGAA